MRNFSVFLRSGFLALAAIGFAGCSVGVPRSAPAAGEVGKPSSRAALAEALEEAQSALAAYRRSGSDSDRLAYNAACTEFAAGWKAAGLKLPVVLKTPTNTFRISGNTGGDTWDPSALAAIEPVERMPNKALVPKTPPAGWGGTVVGILRPADPRADFYPDRGISLPVTATLAFSNPSPGVTDVEFSLLDPEETNTVKLAGKDRLLAKDFSSPLGYYPEPGPMGFLGMLRPGRFEKFRGLYLLQPYDPDKIPLIFIHGLMSSPQMWLPVLAAFEQDPELRGRFQFWVYGYPTGEPVAYLALQLRESLAEMRGRYPATKEMMIINHSLGGLITQLQVIDPGEALVRGIFKDDAPRILAMPDDSLIKRSLIFEPNEQIRRVVFIASPHYGAPMATNFIGRLGSMLVRLPSAVIQQVGESNIREAIELAGVKTKDQPNSIMGLDPESTLLKTMNRQKITVPYHSIIGVAGDSASPLEDTTDTVVPYWSSHLKGAKSEKIVHATHETVSKRPESIEEMKRIARLFLQSQ